MPKYCNYNIDLPITILSESSVIYSTKFVPLYEGNAGKELRYFTSLIPLPIDVGTEASINFLESIVSANSNIFSADLIKNIIIYK